MEENDLADFISTWLEDFAENEQVSETTVLLLARGILTYQALLRNPDHQVVLS